MLKIEITTDRLPQPDRHKGAVLEVSEDKAASLIAQGFARLVAAPTEEKPAAPVAAPARRRARSEAL